VKLVDALNEGHVEIEFKSLISGRKIKKIYTCDIKQAASSDAIVVWDVIDEHFDDIRQSTILEWRLLNE